MGKLVKVLVLLAVVAVAIVLVVKYTGGSDKQSAPPAAVSPAQGSNKDQPKAKKDKPELQEKYGFAPAGGGE